MHFKLRDKKYNRAFVFLGAVLLLYSAPSLAQQACGPLSEGQFGPFDYTSAEGQANLNIVESYHFGPQVQMLRGAPGGDLSYTLGAFPNHHRALERMMELSLRTKSVKPLGARYNLPCYFDRALRMKPDDGIVYMLFGNYLSRLGKTHEAKEKYQEAVRLLPDNGNINYNVGLFYFNQKDFELSYQHAKKAYDAGFPLPGLKNKLQKAGKWREG